MSLRIRHRPEAERHVRRAHAWWNENREASPDLFISEFDDCLRLLEQTPDIGRPYKHRKIPGLRRILLIESRYHVYYVHMAASQEVLILAVWSALRSRPPPMRGL